MNTTNPRQDPPAPIMGGFLLFLTLLLTGPLHAGPAPTPSWGIGPFVRADAANPILGPLAGPTFLDPMSGKQVAWEQDNVFNPAACVRDGKICVLYRAEDNSGQGVGAHTSRIGLAESADGLHFARRPTPVLYPAEDAQKPYDWPGGCEDPRVVETDDGGYFLTYTSWNRQTARLSVATSRDLVHWDKRGPAFAQAYGGKFLDTWSKSGSIVARLIGDHLVAARIHGFYWMLWGEGIIHAAISLDGVDWTPILDGQGNLRDLMTTRRGHFDSGLVEAGPPAVLTDHGIIFLYNGKNADGTDGDPTVGAGAYSAGEALFDAADPTHLLQRTDGYFLTPERPYERIGQYGGGTVFIEGLAHFQKRWWLYYGTADSHVAVAETDPEPAAK